MTNFISSYQQQITNGMIDADDKQLIVVQDMQICFTEIEGFCEKKDGFNFSGLLGLSSAEKKPVKGLYLWGGVGRGKTHLLDLFFDCLQTQKKLRLHFHRFMQIVHELIEKLGEVETPLTKIAADFSAKYQIICLDEMFVVDITDAMLLSEFFKQLIDQGVILLFTSNIEPDSLYKDGLQRSRFLPAIDLIKCHSHVINLTGDDDYRLHALEKTPLYQVVDDETIEEIHNKSKKVIIEENMTQLFDTMAGTKVNQDRDDLIINYRRLPVKKWESGIVWFSFDMICNTYRNSSDYLRVATFFHTVMITDIYCLNSEQDDVARRFINLVDIFYDRYINIIVSAEALPEHLYSGTRLEFEFVRTASRLTEMQTASYLSKSKRYKEVIEAHLEEHEVAPLNENFEQANPTRFGDWVSNGRCSDF